MVYPGPDYNRVLVEKYLDNKLAPDGDPEKPPRHAPRNWWLRIGLLAGMVVGAVVGAIIGNRFYYVSSGSELLVGLVVGLVLGGILGTICGLIGEYLYNIFSKNHAPHHPSI
jgi:uncharacterized membrane protein